MYMYILFLTNTDPDQAVQAQRSLFLFRQIAYAV